MARDRYLVKETVVYAVHAESPDEACMMILQAEDRDQLCVDVEERWAVLDSGEDAGADTTNELLCSPK